LRCKKTLLEIFKTCLKRRTKSVKNKNWLTENVLTLGVKFMILQKIFTTWNTFCAKWPMTLSRSYNAYLHAHWFKIQGECSSGFWQIFSGHGPSSCENFLGRVHLFDFILFINNNLENYGGRGPPPPLLCVLNVSKPTFPLTWLVTEVKWSDQNWFPSIIHERMFFGENFEVRPIW
jgi:hypothetical protein